MIYFFILASPMVNENVDLQLLRYGSAAIDAWAGFLGFLSP